MHARFFLLGTLALTGCAELSTRIPRLRIEAAALRRERAAEERSGDAWSWAIHASLQGSLDGIPARPPDPPLARPARMHAAAPCHVAPVCAWEVRARRVALARARELAEHP
jgi:hypothetical protein